MNFVAWIIMLHGIVYLIQSISNIYTNKQMSLGKIQLGMTINYLGVILAIILIISSIGLLKRKKYGYYLTLLIYTLLMAYCISSLIYVNFSMGFDFILTVIILTLFFLSFLIVNYIRKQSSVFMGTTLKHKRLILLSVIVIIILSPILYSKYNGYIFYKNSLEYSISRSYQQILSACNDNEELAERILQDGRVEKYQALLFNKRLEDIIISMDEFSDMANKKDKGINYRQVLMKVSYFPYDNQFTAFKGENSRSLTDNDKAFIKSNMLIYDAILNVPPMVKTQSSTYLKNDNWLSWFKQVYNNIEKIKLSNLN